MNNKSHARSVPLGEQPVLSAALAELEGQLGRQIPLSVDRLVPTTLYEAGRRAALIELTKQSYRRTPRLILGSFASGIAVTLLLILPLGRNAFDATTRRLATESPQPIAIEQPRSEQGRKPLARVSSESRPSEAEMDSVIDQALADAGLGQIFVDTQGVPNADLVKPAPVFTYGEFLSDATFASSLNAPNMLAN